MTRLTDTFTPKEIKALLADTTPGPWGFHKWSPTLYCAFAAIQVNSDGWTDLIKVADVYGPGASGSQRAVKSDANARLIAAAPALAHTALSAIAERDALRAENAALREALGEVLNARDAVIEAEVYHTNDDHLTDKAALRMSEAVTDARALLQERTDHD